MKTLTWQRASAGLAIGLMVIASGVAQQELTSSSQSASVSSGSIVSTSAGTRQTFTRHHSYSRDKSTSASTRRDERDGHSGEWHRPKPEEFRSYMQAELAANPALNKRVAKLSEIQARRVALQKQRQDTADQTSASREVVIKRFHTLLREDMELSERARQIAREIAKDMPTIKKQLDNRRASLNASLAAAEKAEAGSETSSTQARDFRRRLHYLDFLERKLENIKSHPERLDLLARVLRGAPPDEPPLRPFTADDDALGRQPGARQRPNDPSNGRAANVDQLKRRRRQLQRELRKLDSEIEKLEKK